MYLTEICIYTAKKKHTPEVDFSNLFCLFFGGKCTKFRPCFLSFFFLNTFMYDKWWLQLENGHPNNLCWWVKCYNSAFIYALLSKFDGVVTSISMCNINLLLSWQLMSREWKQIVWSSYRFNYFLLTAYLALCVRPIRSIISHLCMHTLYVI